MGNYKSSATIKHKDFEYILSRCNAGRGQGESEGFSCV